MINADLGQQLETFVSQLVKTGRYQSENDVLREGVRIIQDREAHLTLLDAEIGRGMADADAGLTITADAVFDRLERKYQDLSGTQR